VTHTLEPGDLYSGFPEEYYFYDSLRNGFLNSLVCASDSALETYRIHRASTRRSDATVVYRCDGRNGCLLMEVVPAQENEYVLYLPGFHVSRGEAERMGSALRTYRERARRFSILDNPPRPVGEWPNAKSLGFYDHEAIELTVYVAITSWKWAGAASARTSVPAASSGFCRWRDLVLKLARRTSGLAL
jgi:hypothetical protein